MVEAGMDLARLNLSHGDRQWHTAIVEKLRGVEQKAGVFLGIVADLHGPRIRVGRLLSGSVCLRSGADVTLTTEDCLGSADLVPVDYPLLAQDVAEGQRILLDDGLLELCVTDIEGQRVHCRVVNGGELREDKGLNLPGATISMPTITDRDREDLFFALDLGVDYIALSFVRSADDVRELRELIGQAGADARIIAKLEKPEALDDLDAILEESDAIMIARGDLGVEMRPEQVPLVQKHIITRCMAFRKPVITATQMLDSMRWNPRPTRAEVADVANAILDGTDAVMLSGETAIGKYPIEAVRMMTSIGTETEAYQARLLRLQPEVAETEERLIVADAVAHAAAQTATKLRAKLIVAFTQSGWTARLVSKCRAPMPVVAATPVVATARRCSLYWGVTPLLMEPTQSTDAMIAAVSIACRQRGLADVGDTLVFTAGSPMRPGTTNSMLVEKVGDGA